MAKHVFFIGSLNDAIQAKKLMESSSYGENNVRIISSSPKANLFFEHNKVLYKDAAIYYPKKQDIKKMNIKVNKLLESWYKHRFSDKDLDINTKQIGFSLHNYIAEVEQSLATAIRIVQIEKPSLLYISNTWKETPFGRYQSENSDLLNIAIINLSKNKNIRVNYLNHFSKGLTYYLILFIIITTLKAIVFSLKQIFSKRKLPKFEKLIIMANFYQLENLIPLLEHIKKKSIKFSLIGFANSKGLKLLNNKHISIYPTQNIDLVSSNIYHIRLVLFLKYFILWVFKKFEYKRFFDCYDKNYWVFLSSKILYFFLIEYPLISNQVHNIQNSFKNSHVFLTMATTDTNGHTFSYAAKSSDLKVVELQHGILLTNAERIHRFNDYYLLWGYPVQDIVSKNSSTYNKFPIAGYPLFDKYNKSFDKKIRYKSINIETILILAVFPTGYGRMNQNMSPYQYINFVFETIKLMDNKWSVIFRPHPSFKANWVKDLAKKYNINLLYDNRELPLKQAIISSDIVIANPTTAMIESMVYKKPIFSFSFASKEFFNYEKSYFSTSGAVKVFENNKQLSALFGRLKDTQFLSRMVKGQSKFLKEYCNMNSKSSADLTIKSILKITKNNIN